MDPEEEIVPPPYVLEDVVPPPDSALSLRVPVFNFDSTYSHGLHLGRAPQLRPGLFVGRDSELEDLSHRLVPGSSTRKIVAIAAVGGLGKTQLAITYAERYHQKYSSVFWLDAKDESTLKQELSGLADTILEQSHITAASLSDEDSVIKQVKQWFSFPNNNRWLLILDNYDDPKLPGIKSATGYDIRSYFPSRNQGSILITTRSKKLGFAECLELKKLEDIAHGLKILSLRSGQDLAQNQGAKALATRLAGFPLALATAGAYIGQSSGDCSALEYLTLYDQQWHELQEDADQLLEYEDRTLFSTWNLSLEQVRKQLPAAAELMSFFAYLGNSGLNYELIGSVRDSRLEYRAGWLQALAKSKIVFNKAMAVLQNYSLVECSPQGYSLHTCVHDWTLQTLNENLEPERYWDAMLCVASNVTTHTDKAYSWQNQQRLIQHATQLWRVQLQWPFHAGFLEKDQAYSLNWMGKLWEQQADFDRAESLLSCALSAYERLFGSNDERTLNSLADIADLYKSMKRLIDAEEIYRRALEGYRNNQLPVQDLRSRLQYNLALLYISQNKLPEAELLLREALAQDEATMGIDDPETVQTASLLASVLTRPETVREAEILSQKAAEGLEKTLGIDHPVTLDAIFVRAHVHLFLEQWEEAEMLCKLVLPAWTRIYGVGHEESLTVARNLGIACLKQKKLDELVKIVQVYGDLSPNLFMPLGDLYMVNGDDRKAIMAFRRLYRDHDGMPSWQGGFCDGCQTEDDLLTAAMGCTVCRTCEKVLLCCHCYEQHQAGLKVFEQCVGHSFLVISAETLLAPPDPTEMIWLKEVMVNGS